MLDEQISRIKEKVGKTSLYVSRIPEKTKTRFIEVANAEFEGDYGMLIKWLLDFRDGILTSPNEQLADRIDLLAEQLNSVQLELNKPKGQEKEIRTINDRILKRRDKG